ncbi:hypothetical protein H9K76_07335 [Diaphorobacter ruginosibacter]|jgi:hypothetical protein|uniref:Uncharacterized protein n=1 Tax=Diaphorobacter ruginosibacter TaxID=1715720 RepID=A0A7G9RSQ7_9BURK|nr:hypothetical protein [Diaphorobacter ruginosibacter]MDR2332249.1 hypothetical protein [Burkholderiaceae bacterium]QNN58632.1 hypothetical protein H9K76_07335 [Diaphorobacter ruginosibacter]
MKTLITTALILLAPAVAFAQGDTAKAAAKPAAKAAAKPAATKKATTTAKAAPAKKTTTAKAPAKPASSRTQLKSAASQVASGFMAAEAALTPDELAVSERVETGRIPCELGAFVSIEKDERNPGRFNVEGKGFKYHMQPVLTSTGAIRLEDQKAGAVWVQIANKSMLLNQKQGQRMADECRTPSQVAFAENMKINPQPNLLEGLK